MFMQLFNYKRKYKRLKLWQKKILYDWDAREKLKKGVDALSNAVKVTIGPKGRNVIIDRKYGSPQVTKDGVSVAREVELEDNVENMGAQMVKEVASKTNDQGWRRNYNRYHYGTSII